MYEILKKLCDDRGITFRQLAEGTGLSVSTFTKMKLQGRMYLRTDCLILVADYFGISLDELVGRVPGEKPAGGAAAQAKQIPGQVEMDLKACPFCGSENVGWVPGIGGGGQRYAVECGHCGAETMEYETKEEAYAAWNRRHE